MNTFVKAIGVVVVTTIIVLAGFILSPLIGAFIGTFFAWVFTDTATQFMVLIGAPNMEFWQLTAVLAVIGNFFKSQLSIKE